MVEVIGWIGFVFIIIGYILNAKQLISCFYFWGVGNILMIMYALLTNTIPNLATAVIVLIMNVYGYINWRTIND